MRNVRGECPLAFERLSKTVHQFVQANHDGIQFGRCSVDVEPTGQPPFIDAGDFGCE